MNYSKEYDDECSILRGINNIQITSFESDIIDITGIAQLHNFSSCYDNYNMIKFDKQFKSNCILYKSVNKVINYHSAIHIDFNQMFNIVFDGHTGDLEFNIKIKYKANQYDNHHYFIIKIVVVTLYLEDNDTTTEFMYWGSSEFIPDFINEEYNNKSKLLNKILKQSNYHFDIDSCAIENNNTINKSNQIEIEFDDLPF